MDSKSRFYALEVMCRERARVADTESNYWLAEAEEWAQLRQISGQQRATTIGRQCTPSARRVLDCYCYGVAVGLGNSEKH